MNPDNEEAESSFYRPVRQPPEGGGKRLWSLGNICGLEVTPVVTGRR